jgi:protein O-GlcNAc transferase
MPPPSRSGTPALLQQAINVMNKGKLAEADRLCQTMLRSMPNHPEGLYVLGVIRLRQGRAQEAVDLIKRMLEKRPNHPGAMAQLSQAYLALGRRDEALATTEQSLASGQAGADPKTLNNQGLSLWNLGQHDTAISTYRQVLALAPNLAGAWGNLGVALRALCDFPEARAAYQKAIELDQGTRVGAYRNLLSMLLYDPTLSAEERWKDHEAFGKAMAERGRPMPADNRNRDPDRKLRIGYLSSDFYSHPVARNLELLLRHRDRTNFHVTLYADVLKPDPVTSRLKEMADEWRPVDGQSDEQVAQRIRADGIDIMIFLAGRFDRNRPQVAVWRPAPVQVSLFDAATSGIPGMDYFVADRFMAPRHSPEKFSERLLRLPNFYVHAPISEAPPLAPPPCLAAGRITFGSFNNPAKINDEVLRLWGDVLRAIPGSRLKISYKNFFSNKSQQERILQKTGAPADAVDFGHEMRSLTADHLLHYQDVDIALDTFPFTGSTTTFESLWMGVPVVTLSTPTFMGRWTASMLQKVGLGTLTASTPDAYIEIAKTLADDRARLQQLRQALRQTVSDSILCNGPATSRYFERALRAVWRRWCRTVPA